MVLWEAIITDLSQSVSIKAVFQLRSKGYMKRGKMLSDKIMLQRGQNVQSPVVGQRWHM